MKALETRVPPPVFLLLFAAAMWGVSNVTPVVPLDSSVRQVVVGILTATGLAFAGGGLLAFRRAQTTIDPVHPDRAARVVRSGVYCITRNPMYVGMVLLLVAWAVYLASPCAALGPVLFALFITRFQILPEERALVAKFGEEYASYRQQVRRWL